MAMSIKKFSSGVCWLWAIIIGIFYFRNIAHASTEAQLTSYSFFAFISIEYFVFGLLIIATLIAFAIVLGCEKKEDKEDEKK